MIHIKLTMININKIMVKHPDTISSMYINRINTEESVTIFLLLLRHIIAGGITD